MGGGGSTDDMSSAQCGGHAAMTILRMTGFVLSSLPFIMLP